MFTKNQLNFLVRVQAGDDWHCSYFIEALKQYHANPTDDWIGIVTIPQAEYDELMFILAKASLDDIWCLQNALTELSQIDHRLFES